MYKQLFLIGFMLLTFFLTCVGQPNPINGNDPNLRVFEFEHRGQGETHLAWTSDPDVIALIEAQLALPESERTLHINGPIARLPEGCDINQKWSWYFLPNEWSIEELSIELCDASPQFVEENLDVFINDVGSYCPWGSFVLREVTGVSVSCPEVAPAPLPVFGKWSLALLSILIASLGTVFLIRRRV